MERGNKTRGDRGKKEGKRWRRKKEG